MSNELTYILGAGASYQSIPIVKTFNQRLLKFQQFLLNESQDLIGVERKKFIEAANNIYYLENEFSSHQSFDTFFKKLFHLNRVNEINRAKRLLNLYFLWEHSKESLNYNPNISLLNNKEEFKKEALFDKRYDGLVAGLLKPVLGEAKTICKTNFITWNYDLNLIHSIKNFFYPSESYDDFITQVDDTGFHWVIKKNITITFMNGYIFCSSLNNISNLENSNIREIIKGKILNDFHNSFEKDIDANRIYFAWENVDAYSGFKDRVFKKIIKKTKNIVVVGYSFPLYNRLIDLECLDQTEIVNKNVYIQDPDAVIMKQSFLDNFKLNKELNFIDKVIPIENCNSFFIPPDIFGIDKPKRNFSDAQY